MLVLSRHRDERIIIELGGRLITIAVVDVLGDKVRLGFEADRDIVIDREEIHELKLWERRHGDTTGPEDAA